MNLTEHEGVPVLAGAALNLHVSICELFDSFQLAQSVIAFGAFEEFVHLSSMRFGPGGPHFFGCSHQFILISYLELFKKAEADFCLTLYIETFKLKYRSLKTPIEANFHYIFALYLSFFRYLSIQNPTLLVKITRQIEINYDSDAFLI